MSQGQTKVPVPQEEDDEVPLLHRLLPFFDWDMGVGTRTLWSKTGPGLSPPYDDFALSIDPWSWGLAVIFSQDRSMGYVHQTDLSVRVGPFVLWLGRTNR